MPKYTLPKLLNKKYRKIVVNDQMYAWRVGSSLPYGDGTGMTILHVKSKTKITAYTKHRANLLSSFDRVTGKRYGWSVLSEEYIFTPATIRRVILFALENGWIYTDDFGVDLLEQVPLQDHIVFSFPELNENEVVVIAYERNEDRTLVVLNIDLKKFAGNKSFYKVFSDQEKATEYMVNTSMKDKRFEFWMVDCEEYAIAKVIAGKITYFGN